MWLGWRRCYLRPPCPPHPTTRTPTGSMTRAGACLSITLGRAECRRARKHAGQAAHHLGRPGARVRHREVRRASPRDRRALRVLHHDAAHALPHRAQRHLRPAHRLQTGGGLLDPRPGGRPLPLAGEARHQAHALLDRRRPARGRPGRPGHGRLERPGQRPIRPELGCRGRRI